jgi:dienelactone hydrolase
MKYQQNFVRLLSSAFAALALFTAEAAPLTDLSAGQTGRIEFQSTDPDHRNALVNGRIGTPLTVSGDLLMPTGSTGDRVPAVVFAHGSEGAAPRYYDYWAKELNKNGFAVFIVDSFKPRGITKTTGSAMLNWNITKNVSDNIHALKLLSTHPRIDPERIFAIGWSLGGVVVQDSAFPAMSRPILQGTAAKWAGSIGLYGGCNVNRRVDHNGANQAPLLMLLAELDDNTPAANCVDYAKRLQKSGNDVRYKVYPGAYHDWDTDFNHSVNHGIFADCDIEILITPGKGYGTGIDRRTNQAINNGTEETAALNACRKMSNVIVRGDRKTRDESLRDVLEFMKNANPKKTSTASAAANDSNYKQQPKQPHPKMTEAEIEKAMREMSEQK